VSPLYRAQVFFFFRWSALLTVITGLVITIVSGYAHQAFTFSGRAMST